MLETTHYQSKWATNTDAALIRTLHPDAASYTCIRCVRPIGGTKACLAAKTAECVAHARCTHCIKAKLCRHTLNDVEEPEEVPEHGQ